MALSSGSLSRIALRDAAVSTLLTFNTVAGQNVFSVNSQPMELIEMPALLVATPAERKETAGSGAPQFMTIVTLAVMVRTAIGSEAETEAQLDLLIDQVQRAILCTPGFVDLVQRFEFVETLATVSAEGEQMAGEATIMFGCEVYQQYEPDTGTPLTSIVTTIPASGTGAPVIVDSILPQ